MNSGNCPQCGSNGWVLNKQGKQLIDVCIKCGFSEPSEVKPGRRR